MMRARPSDALIREGGEDADLRPNLVVLLCGASLVTGLSFACLPLPFAIVSILLGVLMIAGADVDARTQLLPDVVTVGAAALGIIAAAFLSVDNPWENVASAILRAGVGALALQSLRIAHMRLRGIEGLGFGDVKLTAAIGAWLRLELIPVCFVLATTAALLFLVIRRSGRPIGQEKLPLGAFLCPSLWLVFFVDALPG